MEQRVPCQVYSRVTGYIRPIDNWNLGKREEYKERTKFTGGINV